MFSCTLNHVGFLIVGLSLLVAACEDKKKEDTGDSCPTICIRDPLPHRIITKGCWYSSECPAGTICRPKTDEEILKMNDTGVKERVSLVDAGIVNDCSAEERNINGLFLTTSNTCALPISEEDHTMKLTGGFGVPEMEIKKTSESGAAVISWISPKGTQAVTCALFGCVPEFRYKDSQCIDNYDLCMLTARSFPVQTAGTSVFDLGVQSYEHSERLREPTSPCGLVDGCQNSMTSSYKYRSNERNITHLLVGCWAYDQTRIINASRLDTIEPWELPDHVDFYVDQSQCGEPGNGDKSCSLGKDHEFGSCYKSQCHRRCVSAYDCIDYVPPPLDGGVADAGLVDAGQPELDASMYSCQRVANQNVGVCIVEGD